MTKYLPLFFFAVTLCLLPTQSTAGWFSPSSYEECVQEKLPEIKDKVRLNELKRLCRGQFPPESMPRDEVSKLDGRGNYQHLEYVGKDIFSASIYNGTEDWTIYEVVVEIWSGKERGKKYSLNAQYPISPYNEGNASCSVTRKIKNMKWNIVGAKGYKR